MPLFPISKSMVPCCLLFSEDYLHQVRINKIVKKHTADYHPSPSINQFPWDIKFAHIGVNQNVRLFKLTIKNILCNFIPHETVTCDDRDFPWITRKTKGLIQKKNFGKKCYFQNNEDTIHSHFEDFKTYRSS